MKKSLLVLTFFIAIHSHSQTVFGYWYGTANVKTNSSANNYLVEMILQPEAGYVKGILNYFFKNTYRSLQVKGNYNKDTRELSLYNIPVTYHGSMVNMEVDCMMNLRGVLKVARAGSTISGQFNALPEQRYMCPDINFDLNLSADISKKDSVIRAIREFKEAYQVWKPSVGDTLVAATIIQRKVVNYVVEKEYTERQNTIDDELEVQSDSLRVDFYDNGEIDGDSISVFFNNQLLTSSQILSQKSIHFNLTLDPTRPINEISMFADNLGSIPPNTALMVVDDGKKKYEVRLTSSFQTNGTVRIRRKK
ncbi:MAG: hypothetical protein E6H09_13100 [Bacteroidetes bacterium]|jgi:hypothetical protein|nr:MAG: hypothetical protein E6H09_13100 [Bacteroidota bacterium]